MLSLLWTKDNCVWDIIAKCVLKWLKFQKYLFRHSTAEIHGYIENSWRIDNKLYASKWKHCSNGDSQECNISPICQEIINNGCKILLSQKLGDRLETSSRETHHSKVWSSYLCNLNNVMPLHLFFFLTD